MTAPYFNRPAISEIAQNVGPNGATLFIGGMEGARDLALLRQHDIRMVINCAVNVDFDYVENPILEPQGDKCAAGFASIRYYKLGMIDGDGNPATMLLGGYYILSGALAQTMPERATYPFQDGGNVLINCRAGRSRSVALAALFLHKQHPDRFATLDEAIDHIRIQRELRPEEWFETPKPMLVAAARRAANWIDVVTPTQSGGPIDE